jgi:hypothetical protein
MDNTYSIIYDKTFQIESIPQQRVIVYKLELTLPINGNDVPLFANEEGFVIRDVKAIVETPFTSDVGYFLYDVASNDVVGLISVRGGFVGELPIALNHKNNVNLDGLSVLLIKYNNGVEPNYGTLIFKITVIGPPQLNSTEEFIDLDNDNIPDDLAEFLIPFPSISVESYNEFLAGYYSVRIY